jgi:hypothetical protein
MTRDPIRDAILDEGGVFLSPSYAAAERVRAYLLSDEAVERACGAYFDGDGYQWDEAKGADHVRQSMRNAIIAAMGGKTDE